MSGRYVEGDAGYIADSVSGALVVDAFGEMGTAELIGLLNAADERGRTAGWLAGREEAAQVAEQRAQYHYDQADGSIDPAGGIDLLQGAALDRIAAAIRVLVAPGDKR